MNKIKTLEIPIYKTKLRFIDTEETYVRIDKDIEPSDVKGHYAAVFYRANGSPEVDIVLSHKCLDSDDESFFETLAHECVHAAWRALQQHYVVVEANNHEALAYLHGWIFTRAKTFYDGIKAERELRRKRIEAEQNISRKRK